MFSLDDTLFLVFSALRTNFCGMCSVLAQNRCSVALLFKEFLKWGPLWCACYGCMWKVKVVLPQQHSAKAQHRGVADGDSQCNPIVTGRHGDAAVPHWQRWGWWMTPRWTSLREATHNRSFQKALLRTTAWGMAWKVISINSQSSSGAISKHNLELRNIIVFLSPLCSSHHSNELSEWCSYDEYDTAVMIIWTCSLLENWVWRKRCFAKVFFYIYTIYIWMVIKN